jgi:Cof subfamily protein (haloacid dehalogenase superfamily)
VRLVATDLDGTLLDPAGIVSSRTADAVGAARRAGIHVVPVTGRPPKSVWHLAAAGGLGPLGVCSNGAALVDLDAGGILESDCWTVPEATRLVAAIRRCTPGVRIAVDRTDAFLHEADFWEAQVDWEETITQVDDIVAVLDGTVSQLIVRDPGRSARQVIATLRSALGDTAALTTSGLDWVDVCLPLVSKGAKLASACARLGVDAAEVVAVGDHVNDLSMLAWAGTAMAVGNAVTEVLAVAERILPTNAEHGVAALLEELTDRAVAG